MQPAGQFLGERFYRAGGVPALMWELQQADKLHADCASVTGKTVGENLQGRETHDREVIRPFSNPLMEKVGFMVLSGNLFDFGIMKTSVISEAFAQATSAAPGTKASSKPVPWCLRVRTTTTHASTTPR